MQRRPLKPDTRAQALYTELRALAYEKGPEAKLPTVREILRQYGTSQATINDALAELESHHIVYRRQGSGIFVSPTIHRKHFSIILDASFFELPNISPFWHILWGHVFKQAQLRSMAGNSFDVHMALPWQDQPTGHLPSLKPLLHAGHVTAILHIGLQNPTLEWLDQQGVPAIGFASDHQMVETDRDQQIRLSVEALAARGCRTIGFWSVVSQYRLLPNNRPNSAAFTSALHEHGLPVDERQIKTNAHLLHPVGESYTQEQETHQQQGYRTAYEVFDDPAHPRPDGIVINDDMMTSGALSALHRLGVRPGQDVLIASHANVGSPMLFGYQDQLLLVEVDPAEIVDALFDLLDRALAGQPLPPAPVRVAPRLSVSSARL